VLTTSQKYKFLSAFRQVLADQASHEQVKIGNSNTQSPRPLSEDACFTMHAVTTYEDKQKEIIAEVVVATVYFDPQHRSSDLSHELYHLIQSTFKKEQAMRGYENDNVYEYDFSSHDFRYNDIPAPKNAKSASFAIKKEMVPVALEQLDKAVERLEMEMRYASRDATHTI